ncbi:hypothetical protein [Mycolicibacterium sp. XJ870]
MTQPTKDDESDGRPAWSRALARAGQAKAAYIAGAGIGWPVILGVVAGVLLIVSIVVIMLSVMTAHIEHEREKFAYQCESKLGHSVGNTASVLIASPSVSASRQETIALQPTTISATTPTSTSPVATTTTPTTPTTTTSATPSNPYATMSIPPSLDAEAAACASAVKSGPTVGARVTRPGGELGHRAAVTANEQVGLMATDGDGTLDGPTNEAFSSSNLVRYAYFRASGGELVLPSEISEQITVGERVAPDFISPGDLVFYAFTATAGPTSVMVAISPTLGVDASAVGQSIRLAELPTGNVIIRRPTLEASARQVHD